VDGASVSRLADAGRRGNAGTIRRITRLRPELVNMDVPGFGEHKALHFAVLQRRPEAVRALMQAGANPHIGIYPHRDATGALTLARDRGYAEIVAIIEEEEQLQREAMSCPNATVSPTQERVNAAIASGDEAAVYSMIEADPSLLKACDREGANPLHVAAAHLRPELVRWMLTRHSNARKEDLAGRTPLDRAALAVDAQSRESFREIAAELERRGARLTPRAAVALGDPTRITALFEADPEAFHRQVDTRRGGLLTLAARLDRPDLARLLLDLGLDPDERVRLPEYEEEVYSSGFPLWHAAGEAQYEIAAMLLEAGANPRAMVYASGDAMSRAYNNRDTRMQELLRRYGAQPDAATIGLNGDMAAARKLLSEIDRRGEREDSTTGHPRTETEQLLWAAACGGFPEIVSLCLARIDWAADDPRWFDLLVQPLHIWGHHPHRKFRDTDRASYPVCLQLMLDHGADPNVEGPFGRRLLHAVAATGTVWGQVIMTEPERETFARVLLDAGASWEPRDDLLRSTPLGWAARWGRRGLVELLLERGAPVDEADAEPWATPAAWARRMGHMDLVDRLLAGSRPSQ
jgi:ankyrin repeat protein